MKKYRVAVIGWTGKGDYGHGLDTVWVNNDRAEIVAVADADEKGRSPPRPASRRRNLTPIIARCSIRNDPRSLGRHSLAELAFTDMVIDCARPARACSWRNRSVRRWPKPTR